MRTRQERKSHQRRNRIITVDRVDSLFNDDCIRSLATADKLPTATDLNVLGAELRDAAWFYAQEVRVPNANELHEEIAALLNLAARKKFELLAVACENLSPEAEAQLTCLGTLPTPDAIRKPERQEAAREAIVALCHYGQSFGEGRRRPGGKRSHSKEPFLYAPSRSPNFAKRDPERNFVERLSRVWEGATGKKPSSTVNRLQPGPFARFVQKCFVLMRAEVNAIKLINGLHRRSGNLAKP